MKLRSYLVLLVLGAVVPIVAFAALLSATLWRQQRTATEARMRETSRALASALDREFLSSVTTLQALATSAALDRGDIAAFRAEAARVLASQRALGWQTIILVDRDHRVQRMNLRLPPEAPLPPVVDQESAAAVFASGRPAVSNLLRGGVSHALIVNVRVPVVREGVVRYALTAGIDPAALSAIITAQRMDPAFLSAIFDRNGTTVARTRAPEQFVGQPAGPQLATAMREAPEGWLRVTTRDGVVVDSNFTRAPFSGWTVTFSAEAQALEAPLRRSLAFLAGGGLVLVLTGLWFALVFARRIATPIDDLRVRAAALGRGERFESRSAPVVEVDELERALTVASTERERVENDVRAREAHLRILTDALPAHVTYIDTEERYRFVNRSWEEWFGRARADVIGRRVVEVMGEALYAVVHSRMMEALAGRDVIFTASVRHRDGSERFVSAHYVPDVDDRGRVRGYVALINDVTERRREEETRRQVAALVQASDDAIVGLDLAGRITSWNPGAERLYGYAAAEVLGLPSPSFAVPPERRDEGQVNIERIARGERIAPYDTVRVRKGGERIEVSLSIAPVRDETGRVVGASSVSRDISARRAMEAALREEREAMELVNRTGQLLSAELDTATLVQAVTDAATRLTGAQFGAFFYNVVDERGETYQLYAISGVPREAFEKFPMPRNTAIFAPTFRGERPVRIDDVTADPRYGKSAPYHGMPPGHLPVRSYLAVPVVSRSREVLGGLLFGHARSAVFGDRAERIAVGLAAQAAIAMENARTFESQERARAIAEAANRSKDEFLAVLSHELRTPLNAVLGWTRMLRGGGLDEAAARRALEIVERNAQAQVQLVEDLLDVSRVITGKLSLDVRPVELHAVVEAAIDAVRPTAEAKGVRLHAVLDTAAGPIAGDAARLQQVVWNLLTNAIKFTPRDGGVHVTLARDATQVELTVSDTGIGIEPGLLPYVFDRFRQADSSSTRAHGGLGLGLALVRHVVELHGGSVEAQSAGRNAGAVFTVRLPLMPVAAAERTTIAAARPAVTDLGGVRVLVVDDQADARDLFAAMLVEARADVRAVATAAEAMELVPAWRPDVLLCDIEMPGEDGYALLARVRGLGAGRGGDVPAAAVTAYGRPEDRVSALAAGFELHVPKPVDRAELVTVVATLARRARAA